MFEKLKSKIHSMTKPPAPTYNLPHYDDEEDDDEPEMDDDVPYSPQPVPKELETEFDDLVKEKTALLKSKRIDIFKKLPSHLRQKIVEETIIADAALAMGGDKEQRVVDIVTRIGEIQNKVYEFDSDHRVGHYYDDDGYVSSSGVSLTIPNVTAEDLRHAHNEACAEESFLGEDK